MSLLSLLLTTSFLNILKSRETAHMFLDILKSIFRLIFSEYICYKQTETIDLCARKSALFSQFVPLKDYFLNILEKLQAKVFGRLLFAIHESAAS